MQRQIYKAASIIAKDKVYENAFMVVEDGKIKEFLDSYEGDYIDFSSSIIAPGLVDTHIHGYKNCDVMDAVSGQLNTISKGLLEMGVTTFIPTTLTSSVDQLNKVCQLIGQEYEDLEGAKVRGIFLEGPYFTEKYKGAQNEIYMKDPSIEELKKWKDLSRGLVNKIAIAPERQGVEEFIKEAKKIGVYVALGHSDASYDQAMKAVDAGASIFVHVYNAMRGLHHREPGMVGAAFNSDTYGELIADGHHVHPMSAKILMDQKGKDRVCLITDCMRAGGMPDGDYYLGELPVYVKDGTARLKDGDNLAGSILDLKDGVKNLVRWNIAQIREAIDMASIVPAKSLGIDDQCGSLDLGRQADFIVLDGNLELERTFIDGKCLYESVMV
ncbi:MAG: N-acetylglucosamine-6-phosphate deacetylase [Tissierellia bacterium]|nr:N-acetylglucosamine-6-phosphate deacetylase [Tissierellia bacterium]